MPIEHSLLTNQLDRTLEFFNRVEQKASMLFGSNVGLFIISMYNLNYKDITTWYVALSLFLSLSAIASSMALLYQASYPQLSGGSDSLFYFQAISQKTEANFLKDFKSLNNDRITDDILGQIWRNSQILSEKFRLIKSAYRLTLISALLSAIFILASSYIHGRAVIVGS